jgi:hypothetical protein
VGATVEIHSLLRAPELNGMRGEIVGPPPQDPGTGRWSVKIEKEGPLVALKSSNLRLVSTPSLRGAAKQVMVMQGVVRQMPNAVQEMHRKFFQVCHSTTHARAHTHNLAPQGRRLGLRALPRAQCLCVCVCVCTGPKFVPGPEPEFPCQLGVSVPSWAPMRSSRDWEFVVGSNGVDLVKWTFDLEHAAEPACTAEDMVEGRHATPLREFMQLLLVKKAGLRVAEVVAIRLHAGPHHAPAAGLDAVPGHRQHGAGPRLLCPRRAGLCGRRRVGNYVGDARQRGRDGLRGRGGGQGTNERPANPVHHSRGTGVYPCRPAGRAQRARLARGASNAGMRASGLLPVFEDSHGESLRLLFLQAHCKTEAHLTAAGMPSQRNNSDMFRFRRAAFYQSLKSKVGLAAATAAAVAD